MNFKSFNLKKELIEALNELGYFEATKVQDVVIPKALKGENIIVQSETGSGKTHSFLIPILNNLEFNNKLQAIIISPTRELSKQTYLFASQFKKYFPSLNVKLYISGVDTTRNEESLESGTEIAIATPGRLKYLLNNVNIDLSNLKTIVLDEADMLMDNDFFEDIDEIIKISKCNQIEVFSATISKKVEVFLKKYISPDYILTLSKNDNTAKEVEHYFINTKHQNKNNLVLKFINAVNPYLLIIFANSKEEARSLYEFLSKNKIKCGFLSGDLLPRERNSMLKRINNNEFPVIVCTDIASRGLDIIDVTDVLSLELPNNLEYYYHRAGRTGRNKKDGKSYVFYDNEHQKLCEKLIKDRLHASFLKFENDSLVKDSSFIKEKKKVKRVPTELDKEIKKAINQNKSKKVKPGYKKKIKIAVQKVKNKHRREIIKKDIRRQMEERYRENARNK